MDREERAREARQLRLAREGRPQHEDRIRRFAVAQRRKRVWINFAEIAEWCSELDRPAVPNEAAREYAYTILERDLLAGVFEQGGTSQVHLRFPGYGKMTRERLQNAIDNNLDGEQGRSYLKDCWFPREIFRRWREMHHLPIAPRFEPQDNYVVTATHLAPPNKGGRPPKADWDALKDALREAIKTYGYPDPQRPPGWQGTKDIVEWAFERLGTKGECVAASTVKDHVRKMLDELATPAAKPVSR